MRALYLLSVFILAIVCGCVRMQSQNKQADNDMSTGIIQSESDDYWLRLTEQYNAIVSRLPNPVLLDTLLENITQQQRVTILAELTEEQDKNIYTYSGGGYLFRLELKNEKSGYFPDDENAENTIFYDGEKRIVFRDYEVTCYNDTNYICDDFGFNSFHYFINPKIIDIGNKRFLYSDLGFPCNGIGCGQRLSMIYDLEEKKPTFVGNFRLSFDGFLVSDFDNDGFPDLLVIAKTPKRNTEGTAFFEFDMKLLVYIYDKGVFKLNNENYYDLYGMSLFANSYEEDLSAIKYNLERK